MNSSIESPWQEFKVVRMTRHMLQRSAPPEHQAQLDRR